MQEWHFKRFISGNGLNVIERWMAGLPDSAVAAIDVRLRHLEITAKWESQFFKKVKGHKNIFEIRIKDTVGKIQYRLLGCYGPKSKDFTLLIGATHKDNIYNPRDCFEIADKNYRAFLKNKGNVDDYC